MTPDPSKILIHRLGSLGDTLVILPLFHLINRRWPNAEKRVLTNTPVNDKAPALWSVLGDDQFIDGCFSYPAGTRDLSSFWSLIKEIRAWGPDIIIYANPLRSTGMLIQNRAFLGLCGSRQIYGLKASNILKPAPVGKPPVIEQTEASRILEGLSELGDFDLDNPSNWSLKLTDAEHAVAEQTLRGWEGREKFMVFSIGTKWTENDWGDANWRRVFEIVSDRHPDVGLVAIGAPGESERSAELMNAWRGPRLNCCGGLSPRESAALIERAACFTGHDSGPMHLSAAAMTPCVSVFSLKNPPGRWFPHGKANRVFYPGLEWSGGDPEVTRDATGESDLMSIQPEGVAEACIETIGRDFEEKS